MKSLMTRRFARRMILAGAALWVGSGTLGGFAKTASAEELKIGVVDMQKAIQSVEAGKRAKAQLEKEVTNKKKDLQTEDAAIKKMGEEFRKQAAIMNDDAKAKKQAEIQERAMKFQETYAKSQMELQQKEAELLQPIITKLREVIAAQAKEKNYTVVLEKNENTVLFSREKDDLTNEVITVFNKQNPAKAGS